MQFDKMRNKSFFRIYIHISFSKKKDNLRFTKKSKNLILFVTLDGRTTIHIFFYYFLKCDKTSLSSIDFNLFLNIKYNI